MNFALFKLEFRAIAPVCVPLAAAFLLLALAYPKPIFWNNPWLLLIGALFGGISGAQLFGVARRWEPYIQTLSPSRERLFWIRWMSGVAWQMATVAVAWLALAAGLRMAIYQDLPYYPMIRFFEANALWPALGLSLLAFQLSAFLHLRQWLLRGGTRSHDRLAGLLLGLVILKIAGGAVVVLHEAGFIIGAPIWAAFAVIAFGALLLSSRHCFRNMEIAS